MHLKDLTIPQGDTANLLAQKLPLLSSRLIEQLKYWKRLALIRWHCVVKLGFNAGVT
jgi:hypothetical protein